MQPIDQGSHLLRHVGVGDRNRVPLILVLDAFVKGVGNQFGPFLPD